MFQWKEKADVHSLLSRPVKSASSPPGVAGAKHKDDGAAIMLPGSTAVNSDLWLRDVSGARKYWFGRAMTGPGSERDSTDSEAPWCMASAADRGYAATDDCQWGSKSMWGSGQVQTYDRAARRLLLVE